MSLAKLIKNVHIVNEGQIIEAEILIKGDRIDKIDSYINYKEAEIIDGKEQFIIPGCIDDQVHFREPGFSHKADIGTESRAAVAGGVTTFMEMPNTVPNTLTIDLLEQKYAIAKTKSPANFSFYMGVSNENIEEVLKVDNNNVCGIKIFMGSSTGNMLVDDPNILESIFSRSKSLIAVHCEDEATIKFNQQFFENQFPNETNASHHPQIRSHEACYISSNNAIQLAQKHGTRLHVLHISTSNETALFNNNIPIKEKKITSEACVHHMYFSDHDYAELENKIKCNPAIKTIHDRTAIRNAVSSGYIDVIATDHAPHTIEEKNKKYSDAPAGLPLIQHSLQIALTIADECNWSLPFLVDKMAHAVAECFNIKERGYIREGYYADLVLINPNIINIVKKEDLLYKCQWSPLEGRSLKGQILSTWVNGNQVFDGNKLISNSIGKRLEFTNQ